MKRIEAAFFAFAAVLLIMGTISIISSPHRSVSKLSELLTTPSKELRPPIKPYENRLTHSTFHRLRYLQRYDRSRTVFVAMVSPGPDHCVAVVSKIFATAARPQDIFVGVVETTDNVEVSHCVDPQYALLNRSKFSPSDNIRTRRMKSQVGKGHSWKLFIASMMFRNERYILMMGSLVLLQPRWDETLITRYLALGSEQVVLTSLPSTNPTDTSVLCQVTFVEELPVVKAVAGTVSQQPLATMEFLFGLGKVTEDAPLDPSLLDLGAGADYLYSARLWTSGYTFVPIPPNVASTNSSTAPPSPGTPASRRRAVDILGGVVRDPPYGLGLRPIAQFFERTGVDMDHRTQRFIKCP